MTFSESGGAECFSGTREITRLDIMTFLTLLPTSVSKGGDVPGQSGMGRPVVPLSRDKGRSKNPGTNSSVPGQIFTKL